MAKLGGILDIHGGSAGNVTFAKTKQGVIVKQKITHMTNPQTEGQKLGRIKWLAATNLARLFKRDGIRYNFENKEARHTDRNTLMSYAMMIGEPPFLSRSLYDSGFIIPAPYTISQGTMETVSLLWNDEIGLFCTSLSLEDSSAIGQSVGDFARGILNKNSWMQAGDILSVIILRGEKRELPEEEVALYTDEEEVPDGILSYHAVEVDIPLDPTDERALLELFPTPSKASVLCQKDGQLCIRASLQDCAALLVRRMKKDVMEHCSTSLLALAPEAERMRQHYTTPQALERAKKGVFK